MKTLRNAYLETRVEPVGQGWGLQIGGDAVARTPGPFVLTEEYDVINTTTQVRYVRDRDIALDVATIDVPGLTAGPTNVAYLFALAVKPLWRVVDGVIQTQGSTSPEFLNNGLDKDVLDHNDVFWDLNPGGVDVGAGMLLIPTFTKYAVDSTNGNVIKLLEDGSVVIPGTNRGDMVVLEDDSGEMCEVDQRNIIRIAYGEATHEDFDAQVYHANSDAADYTIGNLTTVRPIVEGATSTVADANNDYVLGNETV